MKVLSYFLLFSISILLFSSCSTKKTEPVEKVKLQLNWTNHTSFAGEFIAEEKYWPKSNLDVSIVEGGLGIDPIAKIISKEADYAVVGADKALIAISENKPIKIVGVDFQRNPVVLMVRKSLNIKDVDDLKKRKDVIIGDKAGTETTSILNLIMKRKNFNIPLTPINYDLSDFDKNEKLVYPAYVNGEPITEEVLNKVDVNVIDPSLDINGNIRLYGNVIITHKDKLLKNEEQVKNIVKGISDGWNYAKSNKDSALTIVLKYFKNDKELVAKSLDISIDLATNLYGKIVHGGEMNTPAWRNTIAILKEAGLLKQEVELSNAVYMK